MQSWQASLSTQDSCCAVLDAVNRMEHEAQKDLNGAHVAGGQTAPLELHIEAAGPVQARAGPALRMDTIASFLFLSTLVTCLRNACPLCSMGTSVRGCCHLPNLSSPITFHLKGFVIGLRGVASLP
jgi:hypothetical protein